MSVTFVCILKTSVHPPFTAFLGSSLSGKLSITSSPKTDLNSSSLSLNSCSHNVIHLSLLQSNFANDRIILLQRVNPNLVNGYVTLFSTLTPYSPQSVCITHITTMIITTIKFIKFPTTPWQFPKSI